MLKIEEIMQRCRVMPVLVIDDLEDALPLASALIKGGLDVLEVTLRTPCALEAISLIKEAFPDALVGAGTIITPDDIDAAVSAGATFLVSPGCTAELAEAALSAKVPFLPGVASPSEAMSLAARGIRHLKFFPAEAAGGKAMLKSIGGPLPQLKFCPTGGINAAKADEYLALENVLCVGGSWMLDKQAIANKDWAVIEALAKSAAEGL